MRFTSSRKPDAGFTPIEVLVTLVVAGVLLAIALPSMRTFLQDSRIVSHGNELVASLSFARSEAIKRYATVSLCASDDGSDCTDSDWQDGWIVFTDSGVPGAVDAGDTILSVQQGLDGGLILNGPAFVSYLSSGMLVATCEGCIDDRDSNSGDSGWVARILWTLVPISDAMAAPDNNGNGGNNDNGGFQSGCSDQTNSNNANSGNCNAGGGGGAGGVVAPVTFTLCDSGRTGETGRSVEVGLTGRVRTEKITCD
jgi:type IV fimbrial biogenesis protein FimT